MKQPVYDNPCLNEMVYSVLRSASKDELFKIKGRFLRASMTENAARTFAAKSRLEEKIALLAEFGIRYFGVFANMDKVTLPGIKQILQKFSQDKNASAMQDISELEMFVTSDKEFVHLLGMMANTVNHPSFMLNLELNRASYHAKKWKSSTKNRHDRELRETIESGDQVAKLMLHSILTSRQTRTGYGISEVDMNVLLYLYTQKHTHISRDMAAAKFAGHFMKRQISKSIVDLEKCLFIEPHAFANPKKFTITSLGIGIVNSFMDKVFKTLEF